MIILNYILSRQTERSSGGTSWAKGWSKVDSSNSKEAQKTVLVDSFGAYYFITYVEMMAQFKDWEMVGILDNAILNI